MLVVWVVVVFLVVDCSYV